MGWVWNLVQEVATHQAALASGLAAILGATLGALFSGFFTERGKQVAITNHIEELKTQLSDNTRITRGIERQFASEDWFAKGEFEYRCQQLSQLYGPLYGHLKTTHDLYDLWMGGKMPNVNLRIKKLLEDQNNLIIGLIRSKVHLLDENEMPPCIVRLITSALVWNLYCPASEEGALPPELAKDDRVKYPLEVLIMLRIRQKKLRKNVINSIVNSHITSLHKPVMSLNYWYTEAGDFYALNAALPSPSGPTSMPASGSQFYAGRSHHRSPYPPSIAICRIN